LRVTLPFGDVPVAEIVHSSALVFDAEYVPEPPSIENDVLEESSRSGSCRWSPAE
jgi:hypothetical protein